MAKEKVTAEERIEAAKACAEGKMSISEAARRLAVHYSTVYEWVTQYKAQGERAFRKQGQNAVYSDELKMAAVKEYLDGNSSYRTIAAKYGLRNSSTLHSWIKAYNSGRAFSRRMSGGSRMLQGREVTREERAVIVRDCLENGSNFGETAIKYQVSYQQVYTWVKRFRESGEAGLENRRGRKASVPEPKTETEKLKLKIAQLEHENYMLRIERDMLKKMYEPKKKDASRK